MCWPQCHREKFSLSCASSASDFHTGPVTLPLVHIDTHAYPLRFTSHNCVPVSTNWKTKYINTHAIVTNFIVQPCFWKTQRTCSELFHKTYVCLKFVKIIPLAGSNGMAVRQYDICCLRRPSGWLNWLRPYSSPSSQSPLSWQSATTAGRQENGQPRGPGARSSHIPMKATCSSARTISRLISHPSMIMLMFILNRLKSQAVKIRIWRTGRLQSRKEQLKADL